MADADVKIVWPKRKAQREEAPEIPLLFDGDESDECRQLRQRALDRGLAQFDHIVHVPHVMLHRRA